MKTSGGQLERLNKRSGTPSTWKPTKTMWTLTKVALFKTRKQHYFTLICNQQNHPTTLPTATLLTPLSPTQLLQLLDFLQAIVLHQQLLVPAKTKSSTCSLEPSATDLFKACLSALRQTMVNIITSSWGSLEQFSSGFSQTICHQGFSFHTQFPHCWHISSKLWTELPVFLPTQNPGNTSLRPSSLFTGHLWRLT